MYDREEGAIGCTVALRAAKVAHEKSQEKREHENSARHRHFINLVRKDGHFYVPRRMKNCVFDRNRGEKRAEMQGKEPARTVLCRIARLAVGHSRLRHLALGPDLLLLNLLHSLHRGLVLVLVRALPIHQSRDNRREKQGIHLGLFAGLG